MMKELSTLKRIFRFIRNLETQKEEIELMIEMGYEENDASVIPEIHGYCSMNFRRILKKSV